MSQKHYRTCNLCEAMCGIVVEHENTKVLSIRGDKQDPFSQGYICPKATALQDLYEDTDRLRQPMERTEQGWRAISWKEALDKAAKGIQDLQAKHGRNSLGVYLGNPNVHNLGGMLNIRHLLQSLKTRSRFSATSVDQLPHHIVSYHLFGHQLRIPVPDINRTQHMLMFGANPVASNGSIMTVSNVRQKIKDIKARNGKVIVVDPRRSETADLATEHHFVRPGSDVLLLLAMVNQVLQDNLVKSSRALDLVVDIDAIRLMVKPFTAENIAPHTGMTADAIRQLTKEFAEAENAVCYGRMGVSVQEFGLLCQYMIMLLNILTGRLDEEGGLMFSSPAIEVVNTAGPGYFAKRHTRVRGLPDFNGEFPAAALAEEMLEEGEGQIKGLFTVAGNPVLSTPNGQQLEQALEKSEFMVCIDYYLNETTKHANIILPPVSPLEREHYDISFHNLAVHNTAKYSEALFKTPKGEMHDWQIYLELAKRLDPNPDFATKMTRRMTKWFGLKFLMNTLLKKSGLSVKQLLKNPHGVDLGPLKSRLPEILRHPDKKIHLHPDFYGQDMTRVLEKFKLDESGNSADEILLIGRRHVRSNNSWMHNSHRLVKGKSRCTLLIHPELAKQQNIKDGQSVTVTSRVGEVTLPAEISDEIMPGVVSIPHGWGHHRKDIQQATAQQHAGVSVNDLTDHLLIDELCGNAAVNGVPVTLKQA